MSKPSFVLSLSGGMDSTTLLAGLLLEKYDVHPFQFIYGSKHNPYEQQAVDSLERHYGLKVGIIDLRQAFQNIQSALMKDGEPIPEGHYEAENMRQTVVPGRNSIFISILTGIAESIGASKVALGVHAGDHHIYPDCRARYISAMDSAMRLATDGKVSIHAPYLGMTKTDILKTGLYIDVPYHLTRTCYKDQPIACGCCGSCQERLEAFAQNWAEDPLEYESRELMEKMR